MVNITGIRLYRDEGEIFVSVDVAGKERIVIRESEDFYFDHWAAIPGIWEEEGVVTTERKRVSKLGGSPSKGTAKDKRLSAKKPKPMPKPKIPPKTKGK